MIQRNVLVIHWAWHGVPIRQAHEKTLPAIVRKPITYRFIKHDQPNSEQAFLMWHTHDYGQNLKQVVSGWLTCVQEERLVDHAVRLETVSLSLYNQEAYLSFTQSLMKKDDSIAKKWQLIESLFKTVRESGIDVRAVLFLVDHQLMIDEHFDFSQPLALDGFLP
ncbi:hypothetical protein IPF37_05515 [bacterium]|nr:MAG: hypothetical protein IPF37_05515 [bacterium]